MSLLAKSAQDHDRPSCPHIRALRTERCLLANVSRVGSQYRMEDPGLLQCRGTRAGGRGDSGNRAANRWVRLKIKNEVREVTAENIMKYINLEKAAQWVIKSEIGRRGQVDCSHIYHHHIEWRRQWGRLEEPAGTFSQNSLKELASALGRSPPTLVQGWVWGPFCYSHKALCAFRPGTNTRFQTKGCIDTTHCQGPCQWVWAGHISQAGGPCSATHPGGLPGTPGISCNIHKHEQRRAWMSWMPRIWYHTEFNQRAIFSIVIFNGFLGEIIFNRETKSWPINLSKQTRVKYWCTL